ncbi:MAG: acetyl-CoA carboxylase biotin carboxyl carrier protein subunit [Eubacteriales bacterium]|nr:acetyl-CoA carboxylase biotin carboxyl carrier protein subunit [Eubacteriales bacterium]
MNLEQLKEIIRLFEESSLTALDIQAEGERFRLRRDPAWKTQPSALQADSASAQPQAPPAVEGPDFNRIIEVKSPVVGIFYEAPEPGGNPFVQVGDQVRKGDVLCLIEVMKQVTEVTAPQDGQVADICMANGSVVEFGQTLIKLY